jgi:PhnB protein
MADVKPIPDGYPQVIPYLIVDGASAAIEFYESVLGAQERMRMGGPGDKVGHAELEIGGGLVMLSDRFPQSTARTPKELGGTTVALFLYAEDVDAVVKKAAEAGGEITMEPEDQFWGDRLGQVTDPYGNVWQIATHIEDLTPEEIEARGREAMATIS